MASATGCNITATGISAPSFQTILTYFQDQYKLIMGSDAVISNDSKTGQLLTVIASALNDNNNATIQTYNGFSPTYALGTDLSMLVQINGLQRLVATNSTATVRCTGVAGTAVIGGVAKDNYGKLWDLAPFTIPSVPDYVDVLATAQDLGSITALTGNINIINTPTLGWQTVISISDASPGAPVETDYELRQRQAISTAQPALSINQAIYASIKNIPGVTKSKLYENNTDMFDMVTFQYPHSISLVVLGGDPILIATEIAVKKAPGVATFGSISESLSFEGSSTEIINFQPASLNTIDTTITIKTFNGYTAVQGIQLQIDLATYINSLEIGDTLYLNQAIAHISRNTFNVNSIVCTAIGLATPDGAGNIVPMWDGYMESGIITLVLV
jgi:hypothetical protein